MNCGVRPRSQQSCVRGSAKTVLRLVCFAQQARGLCDSVLSLDRHALIVQCRRLECPSHADLPAMTCVVLPAPVSVTVRGSPSRQVWQTKSYTVIIAESGNFSTRKPSDAHKGGPQRMSNQNAMPDHNYSRPSRCQQAASESRPVRCEVAVMNLWAASSDVRRRGARYMAPHVCTRPTPTQLGLPEKPAQLISSDTAPITSTSGCGVRIVTTTRARRAQRRLDCW